jgi:uncharacterized membrane protein
LLAVIFFVPAMILLALPFYTPGDVPYLLLTIGRFHPVILHFPIVLIIVAMILELMRRSRMLMKADFVITAILVAAALSAIVAIASGYLLYASGDYSGALLERHLWIGVITGVSILFTAACYFLNRNSKKFYPLYFTGLLISNCAVAYTSHLGGTLTHGENYLSEYLPLITAKDVNDEVKPESEMLVYEDMIVPVFEAKCMGCHNESRSKGELSMVSYQQLLKGGESGAGLVPGNADSSEVYRRLVLPENDDDRMPPEGKTPLTSAETSLIKLWIDSGAHVNARVADVRRDTSADAVVKEILPQLKRYRRRQEIARLEMVQLRRELAQVEKRLNVTIERDSSAEENLFTLAMKFPPASLSNGQLRELAPYGSVFSKLSLVASGIGDEGLYQIGKMPNVKALFLQKTKLNGTGLIHLRGLENLEVLNLSFTSVDDKAALDLLKIPNLREVYLYRTKVSPEVVRALQEYRPTLKILLEEGPYL